MGAVHVGLPQPPQLSMAVEVSTQSPPATHWTCGAGHVLTQPYTPLLAFEHTFTGLVGHLLPHPPQLSDLEMSVSQPSEIPLQSRNPSAHVALQTLPPSSPMQSTLVECSLGQMLHDAPPQPKFGLTIEMHAPAQFFCPGGHVTAPSKVGPASGSA